MLSDLLCGVTCVSDEFTVPPLLRAHRQLHQAGNEKAWWAARNIGATGIAKDL